MITLLLLACSSSPQLPELWVQPGSDTITTRLDQLHPDDTELSGTTSNPSVLPCAEAGVDEGATLHIAWILPHGVPDPSDTPVSVTVQTACATDTYETAFEDGAARLVVEAPIGAAAGLLVRASAMDQGATCSLPALEGTTTPDCPVESADTADTAGVE